MILYELYINDVLCDVSSEEIALVYQSGVFSELNVIQSNRSYNINLPMTPNNVNAIKLAQMPDVDSDTPYIKLPAALYQDGVPVFTSGYAVITEISDIIGIVLTWGNVDNFDPLFDSKMSDLSDTLYKMGFGSIAWNENSKIIESPSESSGQPSMGFFAVDFGMGTSNMQYIHPSIQVYRLLNAIEEYHGIKIEGIERLSPDKLIPCATKNGDAISNRANRTFIQGTCTTIREYLGFNIQLQPTMGYVRGVIKSTNISQSIKIYTGNDVPYGYYANYSYSGDINLPHGTDYTTVYQAGFNSLDISKIRINIDVAAIPNSGNTKISMYKIVGDDKKILKEWPVGGMIADEIDIEKNTRFFFTLEHPEQAKKTYNISIAIEPISDVIYPSIYPIGPNLPDITQGEFISDLMTLNGLFAYADKDTPNTIRMMSMDDILDNIKNGVFVDWSSKVILNKKHSIGIPDSSEFYIEDYAQKNTLDYDNEDDIETKTSGEVIVDNANIDKERETKVTFSATDNTTTSNGITIAKINAYENKNSKVSFKDPSPRILSLNNNVSPDGLSRWSYGYFAPSQRFGGEGGIIAKKYGSLQSIIKRFRMITVKCKLSAVDLYNLKYEIPVFLSQFGSYFAIYLVETGVDGISECKLIKLM